MKIINVRKDGTIIEDLSTIVIKRSDFPLLYKVLEEMSQIPKTKEEKNEQTTERIF